MTTKPTLSLSEVNKSVAKIEFGDGSLDAKRAADLLLIQDTSERDYTYAGHHPGMPRHFVWGVMRESGVSIEPCLPQIQSEAESAAVEAELQLKPKI